MPHCRPRLRTARILPAQIHSGALSSPTIPSLRRSSCFSPPADHNPPTDPTTTHEHTQHTHARAHPPSSHDCSKSSAHWAAEKGEVALLNFVLEIAPELLNQRESNGYGVPSPLSYPHSALAAHVCSFVCSCAPWRTKRPAHAAGVVHCTVRRPWDTWMRCSSCSLMALIEICATMTGSLPLIHSADGKHACLGRLR
jgi:hypothetical protein